MYPQAFLPGVRRGVVTVGVLVLLVSCGKKEPPPSPDRWPPKLVSVKALDNLHVSCYFSEELDGVSAERRENYAIVGPQDSLDVIAAFLDLSGVEVNLVTSPQKEVEYSLSVETVRDLAGNHIPAGSEESFRGSLVSDTIPPKALSTYPADLDVRVRTDTSLTLIFSEPMDTTTVSPVLLPSDFRLSYTWSPSLTRIMIGVGTSGEDTLREERLYNLFLSSEAADLGGNRIRSPLSLTFSTGDSMPRGSISGRISLTEGDPGGATILFVKGAVWERSSPFSLTQVEDTTGNYSSSRLSEGSYFVVGAKATGTLRFVGGYGVVPASPLPHPLELAPDTTLEGVDLTLYPESEETSPIVQRFEQLWSSLFDE